GGQRRGAAAGLLRWLLGLLRSCPLCPLGGAPGLLLRLALLFFGARLGSRRVLLLGLELRLQRRELLLKWLLLIHRDAPLFFGEAGVGRGGLRRRWPRQRGDRIAGVAP